MARKKPETKPPIVWKEFVLFWWMEEAGMRTSVFRSRKPQDIEVFSRYHYRILFHPDDPQDGIIEVILRRDREKTWWLKLEADEECWCFYDEDYENGVWTWFDNMNQELLVIRGVEKTEE
jgi:hypothetical protein